MEKNIRKLLEKLLETSIIIGPGKSIIIITIHTSTLPVPVFFHLSAGFAVYRCARVLETGYLAKPVRRG